MNLHTEFKPSESIKGCHSLYVNGLKTNVYYFDKNYKFFTSTHSHNLQPYAKFIERLILAGEVFPKDGNWEMFDLCAHCDVIASEVIEIEHEPNWENRVNTMSGCFHIVKEDVLKQCKKISFTQFCKRLVDNTISSRIGVKFYLTAYEVYFI